MMSKLQAVRALLAERLSAAAEQIFSSEEAADMPSEQQRAAVHKRLSMVADEIFRILEDMMGEYEARVTESHQESQSQPPDVMLKTETNVPSSERLTLLGSNTEKDVSSEQSRASSLLQKTLQLKFKDAYTDTDCDLIHTGLSHNHQAQRAEKGTSTMMETETQSNPKVLSSNNSETPSEDNNSEINEKHLKSLQSHSQGEDCCQLCGRSFLNGVIGKKIKKHKRNNFTSNKSPTAGQSCCRVCGKFFHYKRSFLKHVVKHKQNSDLCGACGKHLDSDESLEVHLQTHKEENICRDSEEKQSEAEGSGNKEDSDEEWKDSEEGDSEKEQIKDRPCLRKSKTKGAKDYKDVSNPKYLCKVCGKSFSYRASFLRHVLEDEEDTDVCGVCGKRFKSEESLRRHLQTYIQTNDCEVCGKHFDGHKQLEMHMRTHTGEKPYICTVCGKAFAQNGNLMGHMRVHTGEKRYVCSVCGQSFSFKEYMMAHMRIHTGEKPFLCSVCGKGFRQRGTLKTHMMIHTGESTHRCSVCDKKFYKSGALKIHMRSHTGEKPYLCNVCGKSFTASGSLTKHMGVHEGERAHSCSVCRKGFTRKEDLKKHVQTHPEESTQSL
ncbi:zinc finger protein 260-like isoform X1 [Gymnodraco acuticeps]|uniref:Zinc finger protein 260-like isoform X1 n=2 Tax=Gymnodraco acuticeps TaxID=8218 RepID=A0A6P8UAU3_GYMAC|nr:zinc finger protein 260-like isoform X1 [Gymnodraco acuticeps]